MKNYVARITAAHNSGNLSEVLYEVAQAIQIAESCNSRGESLVRAIRALPVRHELCSELTAYASGLAEYELWRDGNEEHPADATDSEGRLL